MEDFWEDLETLAPNHFHYTGVLTLEKVRKEVYQNWDDDKWLIEGKGYRPFYVVDGQQRLTTIIILIKVICDKLESVGKRLEYHSIDEIRDQYIYLSNPQGISKTYLFGYEKDNPSYEFLKTIIFGEKSNTNQKIETLYTANMEYAKHYFHRRIEQMQPEELNVLFSKVVSKLKFNVYEIEEDLDVFVAFETMNNRGKDLSKLELLKNRLIYLSTKLSYNNENERVTLRKNINECWKTIYEFLGKNKDNPLDDDEFLKNHWIAYFKYSRKTADDYVTFLLKEQFTVKDVMAKKLEVTDIQEYITSLQESVRKWYEIMNPELSKMDDEIILWLDRLKRVGHGAFPPLLMALLVRNKEPKEKLIELLKAMERYVFLVFRISQRRAFTGNSEFYGYARKYYRNEKEGDIDSIIEQINDWTKEYYDAKEFEKQIGEKFDIYDRDGFYGWEGVRYFLYEYDYSLFEKSKTNQKKLDWKEISHAKKGYVTVEHIFPQHANLECWENYFGQYDYEQKRVLCHNLGNLLTLSQPKNSSLQDDCFQDKKVQKEGNVGYFNGSYSENEVALKESWTPEEIRDRGLKLLDFLEERWGVVIGNREQKIRILKLEFLEKKQM